MKLMLNLVKKLFKSGRIYLDTASATPLDHRVWKKMAPYLGISIFGLPRGERSDLYWGNPASLHSWGVEADKAVKGARAKVAKFLLSQPDEIYFTSGGTESLNWAIFGVASLFAEPKHLVVSAIEHEAVIEPCLELERQGWKLTFVSPTKAGLISPEAIKKALTTETVLVIVMMANNEIGTIQPIRDIAKVLRHHRKQTGKEWPYFLTDACQAPRSLELNVLPLGVDLLALNGSKIYGPKGIGALYVRRGLKIKPLLFGGGQEFGQRSGTSNVAGIVGLAHALEICANERESEMARLTKLRYRLAEELKKLLPDVIINGDLSLRLPSNLHISIPGLIGEQLVIELSARGVACSAGSACSALGNQGSRTLRAIGLSPIVAESSLRFSLDRRTTAKDLAYTTKTLAEIVKKLRANKF
ncbi:MAG: Cysteine desulfurase [Parcubacteria group bacterium GW2011_GWB1_42_9]|nr:MAG: Cysteine desulfurase [Parcubacteria group bacterium GW2011_GWB1_42_9]